MASLITVVGSPIILVGVFSTAHFSQGHLGSNHAGKPLGNQSKAVTKESALAELMYRISMVVLISKALIVNKLPRHQPSTSSSFLASRGIEELLSEQCGRVLSDKLAPVQDGQIAWIDGK
ncbi:hypothetical protein AVEN_135615-1 [Araneus ventricosus]|uniref:Uncharacterized protein n=1 Tax=Araneus ventricosus TaxID=182803 RepID=A0A4Y2DTU5_ARAVE|nr:hypothetical protein AVEN_135615-1 [Araneus ventricosus]